MSRRMGERGQASSGVRLTRKGQYEDGWASAKVSLSG